MIIIGEKLNGSIPSVAKAIAEKDADLIRERARMQAEAGATFLDVCASVEEAVEVETLKWMIDLVQEVTDTPICVDSPSARSCVAAIPFCKRPGLINSVSLEGDKIDTIFPVIADTDWECVALLCDNDGIPDSVADCICRLLQKNQIRISGNPYHQWTFQHFLRTSGEKKY